MLRTLLDQGKNKNMGLSFKPEGSHAKRQLALETASLFRSNMAQRSVATWLSVALLGSAQCSNVAQRGATSPAHPEFAPGVLFSDAAVMNEAEKSSAFEAVLKALGVERVDQDLYSDKTKFKKSWTSTHEDHVLGSGSFGTVLLCRDLRQGTERHIAVKTPSPDVKQDLREEAMLQATVAAACKNVARVLGWIADGTSCNGLIMEWCDETLHHCCERQRWLLERELRHHIINGVVRGLAHIHGLGVAHFDLKPENILLKWSVQGVVPKINDFGTSCFLHPRGDALQSALGVPMLQEPLPGRYCQAVSPSDTVCTWVYRAPEISFGLPYGFPADVWSLGVIARELTTGRVVWRSPDWFEKDDPITYAHVLGGPFSNETWPDVESAPFYQKPAPGFAPDSWEESRFQNMPQRDIHFAHSLMRCPPEARLTARVAALDRLFVCDGLHRMRVKVPPWCTPKPEAARKQTAAREQAVQGPPALAPAVQNKDKHGASGSSAAAPPVLKDSGAGSCVCRGWCGSKECGNPWGRQDRTCGNAAPEGGHCKHCACKICGKVRHRSDVCLEHKWTLLKPELQFVKGFGPALANMTPPDLTAFIDGCMEAKLASKSVAAVVIASVMWCPLSIKYFCDCLKQVAKPSAADLRAALVDTLKYISDLPPDGAEAKSLKGLTNSLAEGGAHQWLGLRATGVRFGVLSSEGAAASRIDSKSTVALGSSRAVYQLTQNTSRLQALISAMPSLGGAKTEATIDTIIRQLVKLDNALLEFGKSHPWSGMGEGSSYLRPHVVRIFFFVVQPQRS